MTYIAVIGSGDHDPALAEVAERVGAEIARRGALLVCGGLGGVMEAACRGAKSEGGTTVGILSGRDRREANPHVDVAIATGIGELRNALVVNAADAVVAVGGGYGTLSEIGFALKRGKRVIGLDTWDVGDGIVRASSPEEAVALAVLC